MTNNKSRAAYNAMLAENGKQTNGFLIDTVKAFVELQRTDPKAAHDLRLAHSSVLETLENRSPELERALDEWMNDLTMSETYEDVVLRVTANMDREAGSLGAAVQADDRLLDRLGSATPGQPATELDTVLLDWRNDIETPAEIPDLVDVDTAIATIKAGAA